MIQRNVPLKWCDNSCFMDTQLVALLFDRKSLYFTKHQLELSDLFDVIDKRGVFQLDRPAKKEELVCMMDHINEINQRYLSGNQNRYIRHNEMGSTGTFLNVITNDKLRPFEWHRAEKDNFRPLCMGSPFLWRQFNAEHEVTVDDLSPVLQFGGFKKFYRPHAICGLKDMHWETLVYIDREYYKVNVWKDGPEVIPMKLYSFVKDYRQLRVFYIQDPYVNSELNEEQKTACDQQYIDLVHRRVNAVTHPNAQEDQTKKDFNVWKEQVFPNIGKDIPFDVLWQAVHTKFEERFPEESKSINKYIEARKSNDEWYALKRDQDDELFAELDPEAYRDLQQRRAEKRARIAAKEEAKREAERQRIAAEEAERQRIAEEEAERQRIATKEAKQQQQQKTPYLDAVINGKNKKGRNQTQTKGKSRNFNEWVDETYPENPKANLSTEENVKRTNLLDAIEQVGSGKQLKKGSSIKKPKGTPVQRARNRLRRTRRRKTYKEKEEEKIANEPVSLNTLAQSALYESENDDEESDNEGGWGSDSDSEE